MSIPFGIVTWYNFTDTLNSSIITSITIENSYTEVISQKLFILPSQSFVNNTDVTMPQYLVRAAVSSPATSQRQANFDKLLTSLSLNGTTLTGTLYFPAGQPNSVAPRYTQANAILTPLKIQGAYMIYQGVINQPSVLPAINTAISHIDVQLGTSLRSPKVLVSPFQGLGSFFGVCTQSPLMSCSSH